MAGFLNSVETRVIGLLFSRQWRGGGGGFTALFACVALSAFCVSASLNFLEGAREALSRESRALLGGDVEALARGAFPPARQAEALAFLRAYGEVSRVVTLRSMLRVKESPGLLAEVKGVDSAYPLLGELRFAEDVPRAEVLDEDQPSFAADAALAMRAGLKAGDSAWIGSVPFVFGGVIAREPDRASQLFGLGPRVMVTLEALERSGLLAGAGAAEYHFRVKVSRDLTADDAFAAALEKTLTERFPGVSWRARANAGGASSVKRFLDQFAAFLTLAALASLAAAGAGGGAAARAYAERQASVTAVLRVLGASRRVVFGASVSVPAFVALAAALAGAVPGAALIYALGPWAAEWAPALSGLSPSLGATTAATAGAFAASCMVFMPVLARRLQVDPGCLFRHRAVPPETRPSGRRLIPESLMAYAAPAAILAAVAWRLAGRPETLAVLTAASALGAALFAGAALGLERLVRAARERELRREGAGRHALRFALANLCRPGSPLRAIMYTTGPAVALVTALAVTELNFRDRLETTVHAKAPDLFFMDVRRDAQAPLRALLESYASPKDVAFAPTLRGRLTALNGKPLRENDVDPDARWALRGDRVISFAAAPPAGTVVSSGAWWSATDSDPRPKICPDDRLLAGMGASLGDVFTVNILGQSLDAVIVCGRDVDYSSFQMNFALILSPEAQGNFPVTYLATARLAERGSQNTEAETALMRQMAARFPEVGVVRVREAAELIRQLLSALMTALRAASALGMAAGAAALAGALAAGAERRMTDTAVLKMLGARRAWCLRVFAFEWAVCAGAGAITGAVTGVALSWAVISRFPGQGFSPCAGTAACVASAAALLTVAAGCLLNAGLFGVRCSRLLRAE